MAPGYVNATYNGSGMVDTQLPFLMQAPTSSTIAVITSGNNARLFDLSGSTYTEHQFLKDSLTHVGSEFVFTDTSGDQIRFYDFSGTLRNQQGQFKSYTDQDGNVTTALAFTLDGRIQEIQRTNTTGGVTTVESYLYTYLSNGDDAGLLSNFTLRRQVNGGAFSTVRQTQYSYYGLTANHGNYGDLMMAVVKDGAGTTLDTSYSRNYVPSDTGGYKHGLKYYFGAASYARLTAALGTNVDLLTDAQVGPYADKFYQYDGQQRVTQVVSQGDGCSSCSGGLGTFTYAYTAGANALAYNNWQTKNVEVLPDGNSNTVYSNGYGEIMLKVYHDATSGLNWDSYTQYDSAGRIILQANPSAVTGYNDTQANLAVTFNSNSGLITTTDYYTTTTAGETTAGGVAGYTQDTKIKQGSAGTSILQNTVQYFLHTGNGISVSPIATNTVYRGTDGTGAETTSYSYTWFTGTTQMQSVAVSRPLVSAAQNGPATADLDTTFFDVYGRVIWHKDADGFINYTSYDQATGSVVKSITDVDTTKTGDFSNLPSGWTTPSGGGLHLITQGTVDILGRPTSLTDPNGNISYETYNDPNHETRVYRGWTGTATTGPTELYREDRPGSYLEELTMTATPHVTGGVPDGTEGVSGLQTLARQITNSAGQFVASDDYFNLTGVTYSTTAPRLGTLNSNYYETTVAYDSRGRENRVLTPTGTIYRTVYDGLDRVVSTWVGTNDTPGSGYWSPSNNTPPSNMIKTADFIYDNNTLGGATQVGDGNVTQVIEHPGGTAADRVTQQYFDWRDRLVAGKAGVQGTEDTATHRPIIYTTYDNLDEATQVQQFDGDGVTITSTGGVPNAPAASLLRAQSKAAYDDQGRDYQTQTYSVDPTTGAVSSTAVTSNVWYDHRGNVLESSVPGGLVSKTTYDGAGREIVSYATDGASGTSWSNASSVTSDNVLSQIETTYDKNSNAIEVADRERNHDETQLGALGNPTTGPKARVSYSASYYDAADRLTGTVDVGTNAGSAWTRPATIPSASDTALVNLVTYNAAGWVDTTTDPRGVAAKDLYDNLGRTIKTIEAYDGGSQTTTTNKTTEFAYDGDNHLTSLQADQPGGAYEKTAYVYGVTTGGGSDLYSTDILASTQYPDKTTGAPSSSEAELYSVNALGETKTLTDRAGNVHTLAYDVLGRVSADAITTLASGFDGSVRRIETAYDTQGNSFKFTSFDAATGGNVVNQVQRAFNGLGQLTQEWQSHAGVVNTGTTPSVQYGYTLMAGGINNSRLTSMTYPNGKVLNYGYGTSGGLNDKISRLDNLSDASGTLEQYSYLGLDMMVKRAHPQPGVDLTYIKQGAEGNGDGGDQYTGFDRFGRVVDQRWIKTSSGTATDRFKYGYDRNSNALYRTNEVNHNFDELYHASGAGNGYDNLNQLSGFLRGVLTASQQGGQLDTVTSPSHTQTFTPDALGNFSSVTTDGTAVNRTHNQQNEVTAVAATSLAFDKNGNMTTDEQSRTLIYDAWNRLVEVKNGATTLASYKFDAMGRRIVETAGANTRDLYFDGWNVIEERLNGASTADIQYVWNPLDTNSLVLRDRSTAHNGTLDERLLLQQGANSDVTALINGSGTVVERYIYDPYGKVTFLNGTFGTISASAYAMVYLFQGERSDPATNMLHTDERDYSTTIQRWVNDDPIGFASGDTNSYRFVGDAPADNTDPSGLAQNVGHHWIPQTILRDLKKAGLIDAGAWEVGMGLFSGELTQGHYWWRKYGGVTHSAYSVRVKEILEEYAKKKGPINDEKMFELANIMRAGRNPLECRNGVYQIDKVLDPFNRAIRKERLALVRKTPGLALKEARTVKEAKDMARRLFWRKAKTVGILGRFGSRVVKFGLIAYLWNEDRKAKGAQGALVNTWLDLSLIGWIKLGYEVWTGEDLIPDLIVGDRIPTYRGTIEGSVLVPESSGDVPLIPSEGDK
ncbi:MAG: RHS repeat domain-containing protein [Gemmataceae bacterium]